MWFFVYKYLINSSIKNIPVMAYRPISLLYSHKDVLSKLKINPDSKIKDETKKIRASITNDAILSKTFFFNLSSDLNPLFKSKIGIHAKIINVIITILFIGM